MWDKSGRPSNLRFFSKLSADIVSPAACPVTGGVCSLERDRTGRRTGRVVKCLWLEPEQAVDLYDESTILQNGDAAHGGVSLVGVDDEQLTTRLVLPAEP